MGVWGFVLEVGGVGGGLGFVLEVGGGWGVCFGVVVFSQMGGDGVGRRGREANINSGRSR